MNVITVKDFRKALKECLEEANYPQQFSMDEFRRCMTFAQRVNYCNQKLKRLGSGSSRIVYAIDNATVLKLAKNKKGLAQNECEARNSNYYDGPSFFAKVYEHDEDDLWIEMEFARKAKSSDFKRLTGYDFKFLQVFVNYTANLYRRKGPSWYDYGQINVLENLLENNEFYREMYDYLTNYQLEGTGDLCRISSWGVVNRNGNDELVLVDYGLDDDVFNTYYSLK